MTSGIDKKEREEKRLELLDNARYRTERSRSRARSSGGDSYGRSGRSAASAFVQGKRLDEQQKKRTLQAIKKLKRVKSAKKKVKWAKRLVKIIPFLPFLIIAFLIFLVIIGTVIGAFTALCPEATTFFDRILASNGAAVSFCDVSPL